jgi:hypothetical protein
MRTLSLGAMAATGLRAARVEPAADIRKTLFALFERNPRLSIEPCMLSSSCSV